MKHIILLGKPTSGKGTLSKTLQSIGYYHLSGSDVLRENSKDVNSTFYKEIMKSLNHGILISDEIINLMITEKLKSLGDQPIVFDGFPRSEAQADALLDMLGDNSNIVSFNLVINDNTVIKRISNRLTCKNCAASFNKQVIGDKPCTFCAGELFQRKDDNIDTISTRLEQYNTKTKPVIAYINKFIQVIKLPPEKQKIEIVQKFIIN